MVVRKLIFGATAAAAAMALFAGPAQAGPKMNSFATRETCERVRVEYFNNGLSVSSACEFQPHGDLDGVGDAWAFWVYGRRD